ncbi:BMT3 [Candida jiufengensis]|uniref:BMT3 n=1 Tax=Candida jiufengensis TaxID=497108 RepID=UPI0022255710|nr:BMT3 [Candida jiufengensis]KAI5956919.1 BMT3 [Candida jiufengensis]
MKQAKRYLKSSSIRKIALLLTLLLLIIYPLHLVLNGSLSSPYFERIIPQNIIKPHQPDNINQKLLSNNESNKNLIIFPKLFDYKKQEDVFKANKMVLNDNQEIITYHGNSSAINYELNHLPKHSHEIKIFNGTYKKSESSTSCSDNQQLIDLQISDNFIFNDNFEIMINKLIEQLEKDEAFTDIDKFFQNKLHQMLKENTYRKHFYKFAGTSVWLEKYGVHLMVSRVLFSRKGIKWNPQISLLYAQIYDENWNEINDIELILPMVEPDGELNYEPIKFPKFLPIPYYFNSDYTKRRWYGPEDTRIMLIENEFKEKEPIIIFNSDHRNINGTTSINGDTSIQISFEMNRSMFIGWPFRKQLGKVNTDGIQDSKYDHIKYNKVAELKIENTKRQVVEKNWTPFIIPSERTTKGDTNIYLVYKWDNLEILKCDLINIKDGISNCKFTYKDSNKKAKKVGPVRGGTEMFPLASLDSSYKDKDVWIGFLRAHISHCGCGRSMYRPNFYIFIKEQNEFKVRYLSSSISFNIPVSGWRKHEVQCAARDPNVLIPNGISIWEDQSGNEDILSLTLSVADENNSIIHIYGLKKIVEDLLAHPPNENEVHDNSKLMKCVLDSSIEFCKAYGDVQTKLGITEEIMLKNEKTNKKD